MSATSANADERTKQLLQEMDGKASNIKDLRAHFEEKKFTALLKKPLTSSGIIALAGSRMLWDTKHPHRTIMAVDNEKIRIYYPRRQIVEEFEIDEKLQWLAVSPLAQLTELENHFTIETCQAAEFGEQYKSEKYVAFRLKPKEAELLEYVVQVEVVVEKAIGIVVRAIVLDVDGDRTVLTFSKFETNTGLQESDVRLQLPEGTKITKPLAGLSR